MFWSMLVTLMHPSAPGLSSLDLRVGVHGVRISNPGK
jgi:hypothetical protein